MKRSEEDNLRPDRLADFVDIETGLTAEDHFDLRLWLRLLACSHWIESTIKERMKTEFGLTLTQFNLMAQIDRMGSGINMRDLSRRTMVTSSNITAVTDQLEAAGFIERQRDPADRRSFIIDLTSVGRSTFAGMAKAHEAWVVELLSAISPSEKTELFRLLSLLKTRLGATLSNSL
jgi:DNA-binding MarR family transcriptional regulator